MGLVLGVGVVVCFGFVGGRVCRFVLLFCCGVVFEVGLVFFCSWFVL